MSAPPPKAIPWQAASSSDTDVPSHCAPSHGPKDKISCINNKHDDGINESVNIDGITDKAAVDSTHTVKDVADLHNVVIENIEENVTGMADPISSAVMSGNVWEFCDIHLSPGDGHCFLHSVVTSFRDQFVPSVEMNKQFLITAMKMELSRNSERYLPFVEGSDVQNLYDGFNEYICHKMYDIDFGDLVPDIICNALDIKCIIINEDRYKTYSLQTAGSNLNGTTLLLHKCGKHYNAISRKIMNKSLD